MKKLVVILVLIVLSATYLSAQNYQESVYLKNGSIIKGTIIEQTPNVSYKVQTSDGSVFVCEWDDVLKITKEIQTQNHDVDYYGELITGFGFGIVSDLPMDRVYINTVQGIKVGKYFSTGAGIGLDVIMPYVFTYNQPELFMPIYLNVKGHLPCGKRTSCFLSFNIGGVIGLTAGVLGVNGVLVEPSIGVSIINRVNLSVGYDYNLFIENSRYGNITANSSTINLKVALRFDNIRKKN